MVKITYQYADWGCDNPMDYMTDVIITDKGKIVYAELLK